MIIAADGKNSDIRFLSKIGIQKWDETQDAIACTVSHEKAHNQTSIEVLNSGGPCTLVPLKNAAEGNFQSAVVWMEHRSRARRLMDVSEKDFSNQLSLRTNYILGQCNLTSKRESYSVVTQLANKFYDKRVALIAESAHVMPPIGAQGLNTSFEDIALLTDMIKKAHLNHFDIGTYALLKSYGETRRRKTLSKILGITLLNKSAKSDLKLTKSLRKFGLNLINKNFFVKQTLMKVGLGKM